MVSYVILVVTVKYSGRTSNISSMVATYVQTSGNMKPTTMLGVMCTLSLCLNLVEGSLHRGRKIYLVGVDDLGDNNEYNNKASDYIIKSKGTSLTFWIY